MAKWTFATERKVPLFPTSEREVTRRGLLTSNLTELTLASGCRPAYLPRLLAVWSSPRAALIVDASTHATTGSLAHNKELGTLDLDAQ